MTAPAKPTAQKATWATDSTIYVAWTPPAVMTGVVGYRIEYADNPLPLSDGSLIMDGGVNVGLVSSTILTGMVPAPFGGSKAIRVGTRNAAGEYGWFGTRLGGTTSAIFTSGDNDGWSRFGTLPAGLASPSWGPLRRAPVYVNGASAVSGLLCEITRSGSGSVAPGAVGLERTFTGLTIGATYKLTGTAISLQGTTPTGNIYRWAVVGIGSGSNATTSNTTTPVAIPEYAFVATATTHVVRLELNETAAWSSSGWFEAVGFYGLALTEYPPASPRRLQDVALEGSLAQHFAVANDSVGAVWWVDSEDVTRFRQVPESTAIVATFTDDRAEGEFEYIDIAASYDTRNVVNDLSATNRGRDAATGAAVDLEREVIDATSVGLWGVRPGSIETCLRAGYLDATNLVTNPGAEVNANNFAGAASNTIARSTAQAWIGSACIANTASAAVALRTAFGTSITGTGALLAVTAGLTYTGSVYARVSVARTANLYVRWVDNAGAQVGTDQISATANLLTSGWTRLTISAAAPAGATKAMFFILTSTAASGNVLYTDGWMFHEGAAAIDYFDGDTADTSDFVYAWSGTAGGSASTMTTYVLLNARLVEIVNDLKTPEVVVSSITWNAQENPALGALLDVQDRIRVRFRGTTGDYRVVGLNHKITPTRWLITLALTA